MRKLPNPATNDADNPMYAALVEIQKGIRTIAQNLVQLHRSTGFDPTKEILISPSGGLTTHSSFTGQSRELQALDGRLSDVLDPDLRPRDMEPLAQILRAVQVVTGNTQALATTHSRNVYGSEESAKPVTEAALAVNRKASDLLRFAKQCTSGGASAAERGGSGSRWR
jgi:hypothetical protein